MFVGKHDGRANSEIKYSVSTLWKLEGIENKHDEDCGGGEDSMKKFCESLRQHTMKIIDFEKKEMIPLTIEQQEPY